VWGGVGGRNYLVRNGDSRSSVDLSRGRERLARGSGAENASSPKNQQEDLEDVAPALVIARLRVDVDVLGVSCAPWGMLSRRGGLESMIKTGEPRVSKVLKS